MNRQNSEQRLRPWMRKFFMTLWLVLAIPLAGICSASDIADAAMKGDAENVAAEVAALT